MRNKADQNLKAMFSKSQGVQTGCQRTDVCRNHKCQNNGKCVDLWSTFKCQCPDGFVGVFCDRQLRATFQTEQYSAIKMKPARGNITSFAFQFLPDTRSPAGMLAYTEKEVRMYSIYSFIIYHIKLLIRCLKLYKILKT